MPDELLLALDNGTQSVRATLFDLHGRLVARAKVPLEPYFAVQPGWAEQHPQYFWDRLCQACHELWGQPEARQEAVAGVALTTQRGTVVNVDRDGQPLRPAIVWLDQRRCEKPPALPAQWALLFRTLGLTETVTNLTANAESSWLQANESETWKKTHKYLLLSGYLTYRLCGRYVDSVGCQVGYLPFDYRRHRWAHALDWRWKALYLEPSLLPELAPPASVLGQVTRAAAEATGIPAGLPLVAAAADKACAVLGAGCLEPHVGCLGYATTATVNTVHRKYVEPSPFLPPYPAAIPGLYCLEVQIPRGYWLVSWFKQEFGHLEQQRAREQGVEPEVLFEELLRRAPPGALGLMLQPYWSPGVRFPGPEAKGALIGFGDQHTRAHVYRALLEGLAYALREGKEACEKRSGTAAKELRVTGGGAQSDGALQLTADIFGLPTSRLHTSEGSSLGAAIAAAVGLRLHPDFPSAVKAMSHVGETFEPDPSAHLLYDDLYRQVYRPLYSRLKPLYQTLRDIVGYPAFFHR